MTEKRRSLTPLESELRAREESVAPAPPGLVTRLRRRYRQDPRRPATIGGVLMRALMRLGVAVTVASAVALLIDHWLHRSRALGFYIVGAALLAVAFSTSVGASGQMGGWYFYRGPQEQARRINTGIAYIVAGALVIGIAVAIEVVSGR
jgi:MFS family permease